MWNISCVEDHDDSRLLLEVVMRRSGDQYHIECASTVREAEAIIISNYFDLYIYSTRLCPRAAASISAGGYGK
jgi:hypothetical protein